MYAFLIIGDKESEFCTDIADIETLDVAGKYEHLKENNCIRIKSEFQATFQYLNEIYTTAHKNSVVGRIRCGSCYTLIRQTAFITRRRDGSSWGWITCTMPPLRCADQTPSIVFESSGDNILANDVWKYVTSLFSLAEKRGGTVDIDGIHVPQQLDINYVHKGFSETLKNAQIYWEERYAFAQKYMTMCACAQFEGVLIEVAAQHPLKKGTMPNKEFEARLNKAIQLYEKYTKEGKSVTIYVPGSRHKYNGVADQLSLSQAGVDYLLDKGIPEECLVGDQANLQYKGEYGVYNSADECFVASEIFKSGQFEKLICICSPYQVMRKSMLYIEFGCIPLCFGVTTEKMFHKNVVEEVFQSLNHVLYVDHSWQDETSAWFQYFRETRKP